MTDLSLFREYEPFECAPDGYPFVWRALPDALLEDVLWDYPWLRGRQFGVKDIVRAEADDRCVRCGHPYKVGTSGVWDTEEIGREIHAADRLLAGGEKVAPAPKLKAIQWSPCDARCSHPGPARARIGERPWEEKPDATPELIERQIAQGIEIQAAWRILTVHHLNERKHDLRWWNLASLCQRCHLHIQKKVNMARVYPFEHTDWFKPHAAGWYAYAYLGESLTHDEAVERMDELLGLERMA